MADQPFRIPGLGQAKPNEQLPAQSFAPELLANSFGGGAQFFAAASSAQVGEPQHQSKNEDQAQPSAVPETERVEESAEPTQAIETSAVVDTMDIDNKEEAAAAKEQRKTDDVGMSDNPTSPPSPGVTDALEAALAMQSDNNGVPGPADSAASNEQVETQTQGQVENVEAEEGEHPEWEVDSSPYESSSESDRSDSSSDDDSEDEGGYTLLGIEETARLLMAEDDGDGDDAGRSGKGAAAPLRTKNEIPEDVLPKPDITITPEMKIEPLGNVQFIVESTAVIKSQNPGEVQVLERGSVLCKADRTVVGALTDILGNVRSPVYVLRFATEEEAKETLEAGTQLFYAVDHAVYAFTQTLKQVKGTDASNLHDEEVGADEMEFSDDEKEADFKRQQKLKKRGGKAGRGGRDLPPHARNNNEPVQTTSGGNLNYDDEDGPYKPLSRPSTFAQGYSVPSLPPKPEFSQPRGGFSHGNRDSRRGGRGDFRGRGRGNHRGADRRFGLRGGNGDNGYSPTQDDRSSTVGESPHTPTSLNQNPHLPPPPFGVTPPIPPPAQTGQWSANYPPLPPTPGSFTHGQIPPLPTTPNFGAVSYPAWPQAQGQLQNQGQQYQYRQAASPHSVPPAWPGAAAPNPPAGAYSTPNHYLGAQYGQQHHGGTAGQQAHPLALPYQQHQQSYQQHHFQQTQQPYQQHQLQQNQQPSWGQQGSPGNTQGGQ
ncbi:Gar1/Naf1 RNA binding region-domain-containing protein [Immersiella caudata]|uniref:H/ACA ribonucleoprotein complex non-core subunit NAF1 n=1 Tax=Immersiella caudata TaxID=314043 RepID=A0AA39WR26_9PEZI|nr:Gar1/Naf1 RNA binding region-domain-containing protein [Immersiella caudata]